jgi:hypothetical protein
MKFPQGSYDVQKSVGGGVIEVQRSVINNPPDSPYLPTADDYGVVAWTCDPADVTTAAQLTVSQTLYGALLVVPNQPAGNVGHLSFAPHTVQGAETNFNGLALYSLNAAYTTATLIIASATQTWTGITPDTIVDAALTTTEQIGPGYYIAAFLGSTSGTAMSLHGELGTIAAVVNASKNGAPSKYRSFTLPTQTAFPSTITLSATTPSAFVPFIELW